MIRGGDSALACQADGPTLPRSAYVLGIPTCPPPPRPSRLPASSASVSPLLLRPQIHNVHEVATLLKMYFRELPDPVVPTTHYNHMLEASVKAHPEFVEETRNSVAQFPKINCTCLRLLFAFLLRVSLCSSDNKMTTENLGIVFAPNLLRAPNATEMTVMDVQVRCVA